MHTTAIILAAGSGRRAGGAIAKQWQPLGGKPVLSHTINAFQTHPRIDEIILVGREADIAAGLFAPFGAHKIVAGGSERRDSVLAGLLAAERSDIVLIHDGARPLVSADLIDRVLSALDTAPAAAPALPVTDALWRGVDAKVSGVQDRSGLFRAQTPQGFHTPAITAAHKAHDGPASDDVEVARAAGIEVAIVAGEAQNLKITLPEDFDRAETFLRAHMDIRTGNGFDVHRFGPGGQVTLCGVQIPFGRALQGHSDADVGMHAVTDAIYGALAMGDIGQHFPPSDPQWKGAASEIFLRHACALAREHGFDITHMDCTLICEQPKIGPHSAAMRAAMAGIMGLDLGRVSVKATTSERLGFTGREEGIAAMATATLVKS